MYKRITVTMSRHAFFTPQFNHYDYWFFIPLDSSEVASIHSVAKPDSINRLQPSPSKVKGRGKDVALSHLNRSGWKFCNANNALKKYSPCLSTSCRVHFNIKAVKGSDSQRHRFSTSSISKFEPTDTWLVKLEIRRKNLKDHVRVPSSMNNVG